MWKLLLQRLNPTPESTDDAISDIIGDTDAETGDTGEVNPLIDLIRAPGYNGGPVSLLLNKKTSNWLPIT